MNSSTFFAIYQSMEFHGMCFRELDILFFLHKLDGSLSKTAVEKIILKLNCYTICYHRYWDILG